MGKVSSLLAAVVVAALAGCASAGTACAQWWHPPVSDIDPRLMYIDQMSVLGNKIDSRHGADRRSGPSFRWEEMLGKPFILVLSYYTCDGSCSVINRSWPVF